MCSIAGILSTYIPEKTPVRGWRICLIQDGVWLTSQFTQDRRMASHPYRWGRGNRETVSAHAIPDLSNECGLHAYTDSMVAAYNLRRDMHWSGEQECVVQVSLWGCVVIGQIGYRAQYGRIEGILPLNIMGELSGMSPLQVTDWLQRKRYPSDAEIAQNFPKLGLLNRGFTHY